MKGKRIDKKLVWLDLFLAALAVCLVVLAVVVFTGTDYIAQSELPYYCMYQWEDEIAVTVKRQDGALVETVVCNTQRAEENALQIGWRSMVYWGYRGAIPFASSYAHGEEEPKMNQAVKDNYQLAKNINMFGRDYSVIIRVVGRSGAVLWQESYHP